MMVDGSGEATGGEMNAFEWQGGEGEPCKEGIGVPTLGGPGAHEKHQA